MIENRKPGDGAASPGQIEKTKTLNNTITCLIGTSLDELTLSWEKKKIFLIRFESLSDRAKVCNAFYTVARKNKNSTAVALFDLVTATMFGINSTLLPYFYTYRQGAIQFAEYVLEKERLPEDIRRAIKEYVGAKYKNEYLEKDLPTEKQIKYIKDLGYEGSVRNKLEATEIISQLKNQSK